MSLSPLARRTSVVATVAALSLAWTGPAFAERVSVPDPEDVSGASLTDITKVVANHKAATLKVRTHFVEMKPNSDAGPSELAVFVDTDPARNGPEFRLGTGLQRGTDYQLVRMRNWAPSSGPLTCRHSMTLDFQANVARARFGRGCLGTPDEVRVGAKMVDLYDGSHPVVDWLKKPRGWTRWLAVG